VVEALMEAGATEPAQRRARHAIAGARPTSAMAG
jgi:hypothetical protein